VDPVQRLRQGPAAHRRDQRRPARATGVDRYGARARIIAVVARIHACENADSVPLLDPCRACAACRSLSKRSHTQAPRIIDSATKGAVGRCRRSSVHSASPARRDPAAVTRARDAHLP
jgi:hypothetical protein